MIRSAILRGLASGTFTAIAGLSKLHPHAAHLADSGAVQTGNDNEVVLLVSGISGLTAIIVALITIFGRAWLDNRDKRSAPVRAANNEATDALVAELVRKEETIQRLRAHDRDHHDDE